MDEPLTFYAARRVQHILHSCSGETNSVWHLAWILSCL